MHSSVRICARAASIAQAVVTQRSLRIVRPVRETALHESDFYYVSFLLMLFCPHCVKVMSRERSFVLLLMLTVFKGTLEQRTGVSATSRPGGDGDPALLQGGRWSRWQSPRGYRRPAGRNRSPPGLRNSGLARSFTGTKGKNPI